MDCNGCSMPKRLPYHQLHTDLRHCLGLSRKQGARLRSGPRVALGRSTPWDTLGVAKDADQETIRRAYRKKALKHHPDLDNSPDAPRLFVTIHEAYEILIGRRRGKEPSSQHAKRSGWDFHDWYWNFMTRRRQAPCANQPLATAHLKDQLAGLKRKAAARRAQSRPKPPRKSSEWPSCHPKQQADATSTVLLQHNAGWQSEHDARRLSSLNQSGTVGAHMKDQRAPGSHAASGALRHDTHLDASLQQVAAEDRNNLAQPSVRQPLRREGVIGCLQEFLSNAVALRARVGDSHLHKRHLPVQGSMHEPVVSEETMAASSVATMARPLAATQETSSNSREGPERASWPQQSEAQNDHSDDIQDNSLKSQLAGLKRRAAMRRAEHSSI